MLAIRLSMHSDRPLTIGEKFLVALTAALAVATLALAGPAGTLRDYPLCCLRSPTADA